MAGRNLAAFADDGSFERPGFGRRTCVPSGDAGSKESSRRPARGRGAGGLRHNSGLALIVILTLALGTGASTWNFAMLNQWVIQAVSFPHPDRLVVLWEMDTKKGLISTVPAPDYLDWKRGNQVMESLSAWSSSEFSLNGDEVPQRIPGGRVSADFFRTLDVHPVIGRDFLETDDRNGAGASHVALVSYGLWQQRFHS